MPSAPSRAWDPERYRRHAAPRLRPAIDLVARIPRLAAQRIVDLGCGSGEPTRLLSQRWPRAAIVALDAAPAMLAEAARRPHPRILWVQADVAGWKPAVALDLVFSNATLHWLPDHERLFPRLVGMLAPAGVLAVQVPDSHELASHRLLRALLAERAPDGQPFGSAALRAERERRPVLDPRAYARLLRPLCDEVHAWREVYDQRLQGPDAVFSWLRGTTLVGVLETLERRDPAVRRAFLERLRAGLAEAYPSARDGSTPFPFPRTFVVARRG